MDLENTKIAFIGGGNMARAMISGLINAGIDAKRIVACAPTPKTRSKLVSDYGINVAEKNSFALHFADVIFLATKPKFIEQVCKELTVSGSSVKTEKLYISIAAGINIEQLQDFLKGSNRVVTAMPNLPTAISKGVTGLYPCAELSSEDKVLTSQLITAMGVPIWLNKASQMPVIVAASGSAPAYFYLFMEAMIDAAQQLGLDQEQAKQAVLKTAQGSVDLACNSELNVKELREQVTSPNGTTAKAIECFEQNDFRQIIKNAMNEVVNKCNDSL